MKTVQDKEKFVELRAGGMSFAKISTTIGVSKPILIKWNLEFSREIENRRFLETEEMLEQHQLMHISRLKTFGEILAKALKELHNRDLNMVSTKDLIALINSLEGKLMRDGASIGYVTDQHTSVLDSIGGRADYVKIGLFDQK
jgi:hypothetical protein